MKKIPLLFALLAASCGSPAREVRNIVSYENSVTGGAPTLENDALELRFLPDTAEIVLTEKASGRVWRSTPENSADDPGADPITKQLMMSQFSLQYSDEAGVEMTLYSGRHSVEGGAYRYALVDGGLEVDYTVGVVARTYRFPAALPEKRMLAFLEQMERADRRKVEASYRLYDINNLRSGDDRSVLLALYPDLAGGKVYVLRDNTQEYMRAQIEEFFALAGYTEADYLADTARYLAAGAAEKPAFNVTLRYELDGNSLVVSAPFDKIAYRAAYPVTQLTLLPFFGAGGLEDSGYLFVPDGSGALLYFNNGRQNQTPYNSNVYGWDEAMPRDAVINDNRAPFPVFGVQKNGAALLCVIEEGASYAAVRADVSGRNCSYNRVYAQFALVHGAKMDVSGRSDRAVYLYENRLPAGERIVERFIFCAKDGYAGMAGEYRAYLQKKYPALKERTAGGVPVAVEIVGAVTKTRHRLGIPFNMPLRLTSYREAEAMIGDFAALGWKDARVKLTGWFNGGVDHSVPSDIRLIGELGSKRDFRNLADAAARYGCALYAEADFLYMRDNRLFDGFDLYRDAARYVSRERIALYPYSFVWFGEREDWGSLSHLARPAYMTGLVDGFAARAGGLGVGNIAFRTIGAKLAGDYNEKRLISREASMNAQSAKLAELRRAGRGVLVESGCAYAAPYASFITDMALGDQGFGITDVSVPFYPIALHGLVPYTGRAVNLAEDYTKHLLETVAGGAGLYFSFMAEESAVLQETKFRQFYANEHGKWADDAAALYRRFAAGFDGLFSQYIEDHEILAPGVTVTEYEDGTKVVVNSGSVPWEYNGVRVAAEDYAVIR